MEGRFARFVAMMMVVFFIRVKWSLLAIISRNGLAINKNLKTKHQTEDGKQLGIITLLQHTHFFLNWFVRNTTNILIKIF